MKTEYVYIAQLEGHDLYKIGRTTQDPEQRLRQLQTGTPHEIRLHDVFPTPESETLEKALHTALSDHHEKGEWFSADHHDELNPFPSIGVVLAEHYGDVLIDFLEEFISKYNSFAYERYRSVLQALVQLIKRDTSGDPTVGLLCTMLAGFEYDDPLDFTRQTLHRVATQDYERHDVDESIDTIIDRINE